MREEAVLWIKQAERDYEAAGKNLKIGEYYLVAFLCHQALEKGLKALYLERLKTNPGPIHSLLTLATAVGVPEGYFTTLRKVSVDFVATRYPDAAAGLPYEIYDKAIATERLEDCGKVMMWVRKELNR